MDPTELWNIINKGGLPFGLFVLLLAYYRKWVVPGWLLTERDRRIGALEGEVVQWRTMALQSLGLSARFASVALPSGVPVPAAPPANIQAGG